MNCRDTSLRYQCCWTHAGTVSVRAQHPTTWPRYSVDGTVPSRDLHSASDHVDGPAT